MLVDRRAARACPTLDRQLLAGYLTSGRPVLVLATKMDKFTPSAQRVAKRAIEREIAAAFPVHTAQVTVVGFSATRRIGIEEAEAMLAGWLGESAYGPGDAGFADAISGDTKEGAPRSRGMARGPKDPR